MDEFVRDVLTGLDLKDYIEKFREEGIDKTSFFCLGDEEIRGLFDKMGPRAKFKAKLKALKAQNANNQASSNSNTSDNGKRKTEEVSDCVPKPKPKRDTTNSEMFMLKEVKTIMTSIRDKLPHQDNTKLNAFLKDKIAELETEKRELVGVFGRTGAGKSSLINAIIGEKDLLPSGDVSACTTVMIKVEANTKNQEYEAEIEFITKEEYDEDFWYCKEFHRTVPENEEENKDNEDGEEGEDDDDDDDDEDEDEDDDDFEDSHRLPELYGEDWERIRSVKDPWRDRKNQEIVKLIESRVKILSFETAKELSEELVKYTRSAPERGEGEDGERRFWPLVRRVTVKVPNNDFLQHVTLVDLPGNGDRNKSRDNMWREVVRDCSTVWVVSELNRAASEKESWSILKNACSLMGNGGQCERISFICTKSDHIKDVKNLEERNKKTKREVRKNFTKLKKLQKHFSEECFEVFTVSATEFLEKKMLEPDETEIPKLQEFLRKLNDCHSETLIYVSGAKGILSLIQGARSRTADHIEIEVLRDLENNLTRGQRRLSETMEEKSRKFKSCLDKGVEKSKQSYTRALKNYLHPRKPTGSGFHKKLKAAVWNNGTYKTKSGIEKNLNVILSQWLTESIEQEFRKTFPNESKPFSRAISSFSLDTKKLAEKYKDARLQLEYLGTEEEKMKIELNKIIQKSKKEIYNSLMTTTEETMKPCYENAKKHTGTDSLQSMRETIQKHVTRNDNMFMEAQNAMLDKLAKLKEEILKKVAMRQSMDVLLDADNALPDVQQKLEQVTRYHDNLKNSTDAETPADGIDQPGPSTPQRNSRGLSHR